MQLSKTLRWLGYFLIFISFGAFYAALGPLIPYYSRITGLDQTEYSSLFFGRGIGLFLGGFISKLMLDRFSLHQTLIISQLANTIIVAIMNCSFYFLNLLFCCLLMAISFTSINVACMLCIFAIFSSKGDKTQFWVQATGVIFCLGAWIFPRITLIFAQNSMWILSGICLVSIIPLLLLPIPQLKHEEQAEVVVKYPLPPLAQKYICVLLLLYVSLEAGYSNWIPTYAIKRQLATFDEAGKFSSYFWFANLIGRVVCLFLPGSVRKKLNILVICLIVVNSAMGIFEVMQQYTIIAYFGSFANGLFLSSIFAQTISHPLEFGFEVSSANMSHFTIAMSLSDAVVLAIGFFMGVFGPGFFIVLIIGCIVLFYCLLVLLVQCLEKQQNSNKNVICRELVQKEIK